MELPYNPKITAILNLPQVNKEFLVIILHYMETIVTKSISYYEKSRNEKTITHKSEKRCTTLSDNFWEFFRKVVT